MTLFTRLAEALIRRITRRPPDRIIGGADAPYLRRWHVLPRNPWFNLYLHHFLRDDDDRALHDHPWAWASLMLAGGYYEHTIAAGGIHRRRWRQAGSLTVSGPRRAHRIELHKHATGVTTYDNDRENGGWISRSVTCFTLFATGPRIREWGFHCPERGWVPWQAFTDPTDPGLTGKGCNQ
jgi:hypothetical protein